MENAISQTDTLTTLSLILIGVLALLTIAGILWGARLKRQRNEAVRLERERIEAEGASDIASDTTAGARPADDPDVAPPSSPSVAGSILSESSAALPHDGEPDASVHDEPIAAAAPHGASPASEAAAPTPAPTSAPETPSDAPVTVLKGLGPKVAARLAELGVTRVGEIAALDEDGAAALDAQLGAFRGRMARDRWVEQARFLAAGDRAGFEAVFGKL